MQLFSPINGGKLGSGFEEGHLQRPGKPSTGTNLKALEVQGKRVGLQQKQSGLNSVI